MKHVVFIYQRVGQMTEMMNNFVMVKQNVKIVIEEMDVGFLDSQKFMDWKVMVKFLEKKL